METNRFKLEIAGLGIIFYSPHAVKHIQEGAKYLMENYNKPEDVLKHIYDGSIVGFCTGSPGTYIINIFQDSDLDIDLLNPDYAVKLCLQVTENIVYIRDLYVLMRWENADDSDLSIYMEDGFYEVIVCTWLPESGIRGCDQQINMYFNKKHSLPKLWYAGVPFLGDVDE